MNDQYPPLPNTNVPLVKQGKGRKTILDILVLVIFGAFILVVIFVIILADNYISTFDNEEELNISYDEGYLQGINHTTLYFQELILTQAATCEPMTLTYPDGVELNLIAIECLEADLQNG